MNVVTKKVTKKSQKRKIAEEEGKVEVREEVNSYFSLEETMCLLEIYKSSQVLFKTHHKKHYVVWRKISEEMKSNQYDQDETKCNNRVVNLKRQYMNIKRALRSGDPDPDWKYYQLMDEIFGQKPTANPEIIIDSMSSGSSIQEIIGNPVELSSK